MSREFNLIPLHELSAIELEDLREEFWEYFNDSEQFYDFIEMQIKFYPRGLRRVDFAENVANFAFSNVMNGLRSKLGEGAIKEHQTDSGDLFYSLGEIGIDFGVDPEYYEGRP